MLSTVGPDEALKLAESWIRALIRDEISERLDVRPESRESPWATVDEAAEILRTTPAAIYKRIKRGQLKGHRPEGSRILLHRGELDRFCTGPAGASVL